MRVPPQDDSIKPTGTFRLVWISRPKKYAAAEKPTEFNALELHSCQP